MSRFPKWTPDISVRGTQLGSLLVWPCSPVLSCRPREQCGNLLPEQSRRRFSWDQLLPQSHRYKIACLLARSLPQQFESLTINLQIRIAAWKSTDRQLWFLFSGRGNEGPLVTQSFSLPGPVDDDGYKQQPGACHHFVRGEQQNKQINHYELAEWCGVAQLA